MALKLFKFTKNHFLLAVYEFHESCVWFDYKQFMHSLKLIGPTAAMIKIAIGLKWR